ncbi:arylamine N-acetyltransferase [Pseudomonas sp. ZM23]|uniref:Arylamine N-acetyltransferase n=1 Tax=Pseudomonas triclosanedens TaxID=2961893 RepID=A0ABY6ZVK9_9PSED|nr:arylamine N-acetyltransferase [Pseudomonas triclosanedens]MCP8465312.1 arylamine N-acetyltransferase [Pseudomonas triclosanedens]MCP8470748.1 arylamine N-acetyltransferase [Pseudomonas triclosanedens]MCP8476611.1 arylamine N-acetyltransferase [Pseudomonas triclosanedens]WAI48934.1 arylamine N-acetyltransferase [Pseudomonas triclosanedens]
MTPLTPFDAAQLDATLARLGLPARPPEPTLENLDHLIDAALHHLPFENLDVLLDKPVDIDPQAVFAKVVEGGRGGYCFELNSLFARLLTSLGYRVTLLVARVRWGVADNVELTPQTHLLLRVDLACGVYLVDIGFGGPASPRALPLALDQELPGGWRLLSAARVGELALSVGRQTLYHFTLEPQHWLDYLPRNWYTSTFPQSVFRRFLKVALSENGVRLTLNDGQFSMRYADGQVEQRQIAEVDELLAVLRERFGLALHGDEATALRRRLQGLLGA